MMLDRRSVLAGAAAAAAAGFFPSAGAAQEPVVAPAALRDDLDLLASAYLAVHPGLDRYLGRAGFLARIARAKDWAARERSLAETYVALARLTAAVRCGHSYPNPSNQRRAAREALFGGRDRLPFAFRWLGGRMIVTGARGGPAVLPPGSEILAVDGVPAAALLRAMLPLARADGGNEAKRIAQLGLDGRERYAAFDLYRPMLFPAADAGVVRLRVRTPDGAARTVELAARTEAELQAAAPAAGAGPGWRFEIASDGIGRLTMPDWVTYRSNWDWRGFIDAAVDRLLDERARGLIVDLRGNEGGTECGWHLLERLIARDTALPAMRRLVRYRALPEALVAPLDTWDPSFRSWPDAVGPDATGYYALPRAPGAAALAPRGRRFAGPVAVLVDAACSSATFQFAEALAAARIAPLVGEPTGGNRRGINGGAYFFVRLPGSGLEVDLPIIGSFPSAPQPDAGIVPDHVVRPTAENYARGRDPAMARAAALIR